MLYRETVTPELLKVLKKLMALSELDSFRLVGGTAIALQVGHRKSIDIDLFSNEKINLTKARHQLNKLFPASFVTQTPDSLVSEIEGVRVEIYHDWHLPFLAPPEVKDGIRLTSLRDLTGFKLSAIIGRREKKDYIDLFYLFKIFAGQHALADFKNYEPLLSDKSVVFALSEIDSAIQNKSVMPEMLLNFHWSDAKQTLLNAALRNVEKKKTK